MKNPIVEIYKMSNGELTIKEFATNEQASNYYHSKIAELDYTDYNGEAGGIGCDYRITLNLA